MMGLSLRNVILTVTRGGKTVFQEMGEMLFTHFGVSGPLVLSASANMQKGSAGTRPRYPRQTDTFRSYPICPPRPLQRPGRSAAKIPDPVFHRRVRGVRQKKSGRADAGGTAPTGGTVQRHDPHADEIPTHGGGDHHPRRRVRQGGAARYHGAAGAAGRLCLRRASRYGCLDRRLQSTDRFLHRIRGREKRSRGRGIIREETGKSSRSRGLRRPKKPCFPHSPRDSTHK